MGLCQPLLLQRFQKGLGHRDKPLIWPIMLVELLVKGEEALQVALFGIYRGSGLAGDLGHEVHVCQMAEARFRLLDAHRNVMG